MRGRPHPVVYLDAFAADHHDDAFFAILGALINSLRSTSGIPEQHRESLSLERILLNVALYAKSGGYAGRRGHLDGVAELCVMKLAFPKLYRDARNDQLPFEAIARFLRLQDWEVAQRTRQDLESWWRVATDWSTDGADDEVVQMMNRRAELFSASVDEEDILRRARLAGYGDWLSGICRDIDLFWQSRSA